MNIESIENNNLFFTCSLIEYIARKTNNTKKYIIDKLGKNNIQKIYELADVYHCENIDKVSDEFIELSNIKMGNYSNEYINRIPTIWEIGKIYKELIIKINNDKNKYVDTLIELLSSWIIELIDNYDSSLYYENIEYIYECYKEGKIL